MKKNRAQAEEIRTLKIEQESQKMMLCEVTKQKKRAIEDKVMMGDGKKLGRNFAEVKSVELYF